MRNRSAGFTLIELLVVIAIIGVLTSFVLASLSTARIKARDAQRISELRQFQNALELYYAANGNYPYSNCSGSNTWASFDSPAYSPNFVCAKVGGTGQTLTQAMSPYVGKIADPFSLGSDSGYLYINQGGSNDYCVLFWRTPENLNNFSKSYIPATRCTTWNSSGQCTSSGGVNAIYIGTGIYSGGC